MGAATCHNHGQWSRWHNASDSISPGRHTDGSSDLKHPRMTTRNSMRSHDKSNACFRRTQCSRSLQPSRVERYSHCMWPGMTVRNCCMPYPSYGTHPSPPAWSSSQHRLPQSRHLLAATCNYSPPPSTQPRVGIHSPVISAKYTVQAYPCHHRGLISVEGCQLPIIQPSGYSCPCLCSNRDCTSAAAAACRTMQP